MLKKIIKIIAVFTLFIGVIFSGLFVYAYNVSSNLNKSEYKKTEYIINEVELLRIVNAWREENNLAQYEKNDLLCEYANKRVDEIQKKWSHDGFIGTIKDFNQIAENLSKNTTNEENTLQMWLESPSHKRILEKNFIYSCLKCNNNYCVQIFGK